MPKPKQFARPPKKAKLKAAPESADEFQEAADKEEEAGGKHRVGDPAKSARAFLRALELYDQGLSRHATNFDLAYNKARLELEITQQPALVEHVGLPLIDLLRQTLDSHRYALRLNEENPDLLFNTSQVLVSLAEQLSEVGKAPQAIPLFQEALELLSACLSRQEMLLEQQRLEFEQLDDDGGVSLDPDETPASNSGSEADEQTARIETPVNANDLLDTVHASVSALTTLVPLVDESALQTYGDMAYALTEKRAPSYVSLLPEDLQEAARVTLLLDRAIFVAAFSDAQYTFAMIDLATYSDRLGAFDVPSKDQNAHALSAQAEARVELVQSILDRHQSSIELPADICWKQLNLAQEANTKATRLNTEDAKERKAGILESQGGAEFLRHRLVTMPGAQLSEGIKRSARTLIQNAQTYYRGAAQLAWAEGDAQLAVKAKQRWLIACDIGSAVYGVAPKQTAAPFEGNSRDAKGDVMQALKDCVDEGLIAVDLGERIAQRILQ